MSGVYGKHGALGPSESRPCLAPAAVWVGGYNPSILNAACALRCSSSSPLKARARLGRHASSRKPQAPAEALAATLPGPPCCVPAMAATLLARKILLGSANAVLRHLCARSERTKENLRAAEQQQDVLPN